MNIELKPGKYILAVSGGVDSMVLLDLLSKKPDIELIVAHFDHGIRPNTD
jgi:tRNA(Ile)-lysidine synthase